MTGKVDKFTAARIRRFTATGMAVQKALPFDRPRFGLRPQMISADLSARLLRPAGNTAPGRRSA